MKVILGLLFCALFITPAFAGDLHSKEGQKLLGKAENYEKKGKSMSAHKTYQKLLNQLEQPAQKKKIEKKIEILNIKILFSKAETQESLIYKVRPNDSLKKIAEKYHTTVDLIKKSNDLKDDMIHPDMKLKVVKGKFSIKVDKSENILTLLLNQQPFKHYSVSTGKNNSTPIGKYKILTRLENPVWYKTPSKIIPAGSPANDLGTRWLGFNRESYGIHGTTEPHRIGTQASSGCVRMKNRDVEELFTVVPYGTEVFIQN